MRFHLAPLSVTLSDLEKSIQVTQVFNGLYLQIYSIYFVLRLQISFYWPTHVNSNVCLTKHHCSSSATLFIIEPTARLYG